MGEKIYQDNKISIQSEPESGMVQILIANEIVMLSPAVARKIAKLLLDAADKAEIPYKEEGV